MSLLLDTAPTTVELVQSTWGFGTDNLYTDILIIVLIVVMLALLASALMVNRAMKSIIRITMPDLVKEEELKKLAKKGWLKRSWNKIMGIRPISEEKDIVIDHEYDGIRELDNPIPIWFNFLFYGTIFFGLVYLFIYQVSGIGMNQDQEYAHEMVVAEKERQAYLAASASNVDENTVEFEPDMAVEGKAIFAANCVACHGGNGEGGIGPNLTDKFWLHGGEIKDLFKTIKYGVPDKGMVPWEQTLSPAQIAQVASYIVTLRDTHPANPKEPQGEEVIYGNAKDATKVNDGAEVEKKAEQ
ncbi:MULTISPECIES: cbb3-type cytochrome c oxidase N-terminal domain-containing protein [unclassified Sphingobacterium]|uniref:cbb3-type cytochrome c oxidase N-terminal domain-containing protein n=1 Tax=unclassified Sphingobacterium TaxID=2609468 RepID=UPI0025DF6DD3|nr:MULTISPECIES: cbb3-type cytochrome c oxidase N-terminal domain-containing protein [unclassified Sphingobacterium]